MRISVVLDTGRTSTTGTATTPFTAKGRLTPKATTTYIHTVATSALAERFRRPPRPGGLAPLLVFTWIITGGLITLALGRVLPDLAVPLSVGGATLIVYLLHRRRSPRQALLNSTWDSCEAELRSGYYCSRDDIAHEGGGGEGETPEGLALKCFTPFVAAKA